MSTTKKIVLGGILSAFALILLFFANLSNLLDISFTVIASMVMFVGIIELGRKWMLVMYAAVSILGLLIIPIRAPLIMFIIFLGYYPFVKSLLEQTKSRAFEYIIKFLIFNAAAIICITLFKNLFFADSALTNMMAVIFILIGNAVFFIYDKVMTRLLTLYIYKIKPRMRKR